MPHSHDTSTIIGISRVRSVRRTWQFEPDSAVGFQVTGHTTGTGNAYNLFVANHNQTALNHVLVGVNPSHSTANRYIVPMNFFTAAGFTNQAGAEAAALAAFKGVNLSAPAIGDGRRITVLRGGLVEFLVEASTFIAGDGLTFSYDSTPAWVHPFRLKKTTTANLIIGRVAETNPTNPKTGNVTRVLVEFDL